jgi:hypothetical protein
MIRSGRRFLAYLALAASCTACTSIANSIANSILSNLEGPADKELPPTAEPIVPSPDVTSIIGGNGTVLDCSIPPSVSWLAFERKELQEPISLRMRQACLFHDYCYRHGNATYGYTQADCDYMLQEHAYRICRQICLRDDEDGSCKSDPGEIEACDTDAKKVLLGVWIFGSKAFHSANPRDPTARASPYFEFDPLPDPRREYTVGRVLASDSVDQSCGVRKSLFLFRVRPGGTRVSRVDWKPDSSGSCKPVPTLERLPGEPELRTVPPRVVQDGAGRDWLVWWRRRSQTNTDARLLAISPTRTPLGHWSNQFFEDANDHTRRGSRHLHVDPLIVNGLPLPGQLDSRSLSLGGLSTQAAGDGTPLRWIEIDLADRAENSSNTSHSLQGLDPELSHWHRSFAAPLLAIPVAGTKGTGHVAWTSRGHGDEGEGYKDSATIYVGSLGGLPPGPADDAERASRPATELPAPGPPISIHSGRVANFDSSLEPVSVVAVPESAPPRLLSLKSRDANLETLESPIPLSEDAPDIRFTESSFPGELPFEKWMDRPPVVLEPSTGDRGSRILFSRVVDENEVDSTNDRDSTVMEFALVERLDRGWSVPDINRCAFDAACKGLEDRKCADARKNLRRRLATRQMIAADLVGDDSPDVVLLSPAEPEDTVLLTGHSGDDGYLLASDPRFRSREAIHCKRP